VGDELRFVGGKQGRAVFKSLSLGGRSNSGTSEILEESSGGGGRQRALGCVIFSKARAQRQLASVCWHKIFLARKKRIRKMQF